MVIDLIGESSRDVIGLLSVKLLSPHSVHSDDHTQPTYDFDWFFNFSRDVWRLCEDLGIKRLNKPGECKFYKLSSQKCQPGIFQKHCYYETYNNQRNSWLEVCHLFEILVLAVCGFVHKSSTLGARDFSCAVSGFGQVLKSDPASPLVSSAFGRTRVGPRPTKRKTVTHVRKNLWYPGYFRGRHCLKYLSLGPVTRDIRLIGVSNFDCVCEFTYLETLLVTSTAWHALNFFLLHSNAYLIEDVCYFLCCNEETGKRLQAVYLMPFWSWTLLFKDTKCDSQFRSRINEETGHPLTVSSVS